MTSKSPKATKKRSAKPYNRGMAGLEIRHKRLSEKVKSLKIQYGLLSEAHIELQFEVELIMKTLQLQKLDNRIVYNPVQVRWERNEPRTDEN